jgi:alpha/beta hydrolase family protein
MALMARAVSVSNALGPQLQAARHQLDGYKAVNAAVNPTKSTPGHPNPDCDIPRYLSLLDDKGHAAVSLENPDLAKKVATFVPGTGQDTTKIEGSNEKSILMYRATLAADKSLIPGDVSVTTWMGYDRPMNLLEGRVYPARDLRCRDSGRVPRRSAGIPCR